MKDKGMKLIFAYDGSEYSDHALDDLRRAGLPDDVEALVVTVVEGALPASTGAEFTGSLVNSRALGTGQLILAQARANAAAAEANLARATEALRANFPRWRVTGEALQGAPAKNVIRRAEECGADLIVVGTQGRSAVGRLFLGSVSQKIVTDAACSVRVGRAGATDGVRTESGELRLVVGVDGSENAQAAVREVARRRWAEGTQVFVVGAENRAAPESLADVLPMEGRAGDEAVAAMRAGVETALETLRAAGLRESAIIRPGKPVDVLANAAEETAADCLFVGSRGLARLERWGLGSTSADIAPRVRCSIEIVRERAG